MGGVPSPRCVEAYRGGRGAFWLSRDHLFVLVGDGEDLPRGKWPLKMGRWRGGSRRARLAVAFAWRLVESGLCSWWLRSTSVGEQIGE